MIAGLIILSFVGGCATSGIDYGLTSLPDPKVIASSRKETVAHNPFDASLTVRPVEGEISSEYGMRKLKGAKATMHRGIDFKAMRGSPVLSTGNGEVVFSGKRGTFGNLVEVRHENGVVTRYAHLEKLSVKRGQTVQAGTTLGTVGKTGKATGYNLHFEVLVNDEHVDPLAVARWDAGSGFGLAQKRISFDTARKS